MDGTYSPIVEDFSLTGGGPFHRLLARIGHAGPERRQVINRALFATFFSWAPLLILTLAQGLAVGPKVKIPFLFDCAVHVRFLMALPILILAETPIDPEFRS